MTAKEKVLERASTWTEEQAERALAAAEGSRFTTTATGGVDEALAELADIRSHQTTPSDAAALVREARDELERRGL